MNDLSLFEHKIKPGIAEGPTTVPATPTIHLTAIDGERVTDLRIDSAWLRRLLPDENGALTAAKLAGLGEWREGPFYATEPGMLQWLFDFLAMRVASRCGRA
jgi:hypothetical protein